jgi:hypothetical protein
MKKILLLLTIVLSSTGLFAQYTAPDTTKKEYKNVVAIDATGFARQFFNPNSNFAVPYLVSYKRLFRQNALRLGISALINSQDRSTNDSVSNNNSMNRFQIGIGIEHYSYISKRWNWFYGVDGIVKYVYAENEGSIGSGSSTYKNTSLDMGYGISPLLGVQFKISERLSLSTETAFNILFTTHSSTYTSTGPGVNLSQKRSGTGIETRFYAPIGINFRVMF